MQTSGVEFRLLFCCPPRRALYRPHQWELAHEDVLSQHRTSWLCGPVSTATNRCIRKASCTNLVWSASNARNCFRWRRRLVNTRPCDRGSAAKVKHPGNLCVGQSSSPLLTAWYATAELQVRCTEEGHDHLGRPLLSGTDARFYCIIWLSLANCLDMSFFSS